MSHFIPDIVPGTLKLVNRPDFEKGLFKMVELLRPHTIIIYGSGNYEFFRVLEDMGIRIIQFMSDKNLYHSLKKGGYAHE